MTTDSIRAEVVQDMKQALSELGTMYRMDSHTKEHHKIFQNILGQLDGAGEEDYARYMVTVDQTSDAITFYVFADEVDDNELALDFKSRGRLVVKIARAMVESYIAHNPGS